MSTEEAVTVLRRYKTIYTYNGWVKNIIIPDTQWAHGVPENWAENDECVEALLAHAKKLNEENSLIHREYKKVYEEFKSAFMLMEVNETFDSKKKSSKFSKLCELQPLLPEDQVRLVKNAVDTEKAKKKKEREAKEAEKKKLKSEEAKHVLISKAALFLLERRFKLSQHDTWENNDGDHGSDSITIANHIRFNELVNEAEKKWSEEGETVEHDRCDYCSEWVPGERRCSCGNRRLSWESQGDFTNMYVYPEPF